jgi:hypothetical protein
MTSKLITDLISGNSALAETLTNTIIETIAKNRTIVYN